MFIYATLFKDNRKVAINKNHIITFYESKKKGCVIETIKHGGDYGLHIKESYEEIKKMCSNQIDYSVPEEALTLYK